MIKKKLRIINHVARYIRINNISFCSSCQRFGNGKYYCRSTQHGGDFMYNLCMRANSSHGSCGVRYNYVPELWYVAEKKKN